MGTVTRRQKGLALLSVVICITFLMMLLATLTVCLANLTVSSSRYAWSVRALSLAEAGVETALAHRDWAPGRADGVVGPEAWAEKFDLGLNDGHCRVEVTPAEVKGRWKIVSEGRPGSGRADASARVTLVVTTDAGGNVRILSRKEETSRLRRDTPGKAARTP